ncbi:hypothetical protein F891_00809, partial [Acinetobacter sp. CIP 101966]
VSKYFLKGTSSTQISICNSAIKLASAQGKYKGRVHKLKPDQADALRQAWKEGKYPSKMALGQAFGISRQAVYRYLKADE